MHGDHVVDILILLIKTVTHESADIRSGVMISSPPDPRPDPVQGGYQKLITRCNVIDAIVNFILKLQTAFVEFRGKKIPSWLYSLT